jgi:integrase
MISTSHEPGSRPALRLFAADLQEDRPRLLTKEQREASQREPRLLWTLRQFFENWFCDAVLKPRQAASATFEGYETLLRYWEQITGDPPLLLTADDACIDFIGTLPEWGWCCKGVPRGRSHKIGPLTDYPSYWPLGSERIKTHRTRLATLIRAAGPRYDPSHARARILQEVPYVPIVTSEWEPKPPFSVEQARQIAAAARLMSRPELPPWITCELWWQTRLALFYFTGLRSGTVIELRWRHLEHRGRDTWLAVPGEIVKTGKATEILLHQQLCLLLACVRQCRGEPPADEPILPAACGYRHFLTLHSELQQKAGIPEASRQSPHAWRRTHGVQLDLLGAREGQEAARAGLDHASGRTTRRSYVGDIVVNYLRTMLPLLLN